MKTIYNYTTVLRPDTNGTFIAYIPAIEGCHALGLTPEEAHSELLNVFEMIQDEYHAENRMMPNDVELVVTHAC